MAICYIVVLIGEMFDYMYLASIWTIELCIRFCDICKDFKVETRAIHCSYMHLLALLLSINITLFALIPALVKLYNLCRSTDHD